MQGIIGLLRTARALERLRAIASTLGGVELRSLPPEDWPHLHSTLIAADVGTVFFNPTDADGELHEGLAITARSFPSVTFVAYCEQRVTRPAMLLRLGEYGVGDLIALDVDDSQERLLEIITNAAVQRATDLLIGTPRQQSTTCARILQVIRSTPPSHLVMSDVARACACHPKTARAWLKTAGLPPLGELIAWVRLLAAANMLRDPGRTVAGVASALQYRSPAAFRNQLRRLVGVAPRSLRGGGDHEVIVAAFRRRCVRLAPVRTVSLNQDRRQAG